MPKICVPLVGTDMEMLAREAEAADRSPCDLVEWRVDHYIFYVADRLRDLRELTLPAEGLQVIRSRTDKPVMLTLRTSEEGGMLDIIRREYYTILRDIIESEDARSIR